MNPSIIGVMMRRSLESEKQVKRAKKSISWNAAARAAVTPIPTVSLSQAARTANGAPCAPAKKPRILNSEITRKRSRAAPASTTKRSPKSNPKTRKNSQLSRRPHRRCSTSKTTNAWRNPRYGLSWPLKPQPKKSAGARPAEPRTCKTQMASSTCRSMCSPAAATMVMELLRQ